MTRADRACGVAGTNGLLDRSVGRLGTGAAADIGVLISTSLPVSVSHRLGTAWYAPSWFGYIDGMGDAGGLFGRPVGGVVLGVDVSIGWLQRHRRHCLRFYRCQTLRPQECFRCLAIPNTHTVLLI